MPRAGSVLATIGNTPLLELTRLDTGCCRLFVKLENQNPTGSIKDRIGLSMIEAAERDGQSAARRRSAVSPSSRPPRATPDSGLALVAAQKGYRLLLVIPDKMAQEKILHLRALGAQIQLTRSDVGKGHPEHYQDLAARLARETPNSFYVNQFANPANPLAHEATTGPEIWAQTGQMLDAVVVGVGSGGTLDRPVALFRARRAARRDGAGRSEGLGAGRCRQHRKDPEAGRLVAGRGHRRGLRAADLRSVASARGAYEISDAESFATARGVLAQEGILGGSSTGTLIAAALRYCREQKRAQAGRDFRARQRQQVPQQDVQRLLDVRSGPARAAARKAICSI